MSNRIQATYAGGLRGRVDQAGCEARKAGSGRDDENGL